MFFNKSIKTVSNTAERNKKSQMGKTIKPLQCYEVSAELSKAGWPDTDFTLNTENYTTGL